MFSEWPACSDCCDTSSGESSSETRANGKSAAAINDPRVASCNLSQLWLFMSGGTAKGIAHCSQKLHRALHYFKVLQPKRKRDEFLASTSEFRERINQSLVGSLQEIASSEKMPYLAVCRLIRFLLGTGMVGTAPASSLHGLFTKILCEYY